MQNRSLRRQVAAAGALELFCEFEQPLELAKTVVDRPAQIRVDLVSPTGHRACHSLSAARSVLSNSADAPSLLLHVEPHTAAWPIGARQHTLSPVRQQDVDPLPSSVALLTISKGADAACAI